MKNLLSFLLGGITLISCQKQDAGDVQKNDIKKEHVSFNANSKRSNLNISKTSDYCKLLRVQVEQGEINVRNFRDSMNLFLSRMKDSANKLVSQKPKIKPTNSLLLSQANSVAFNSFVYRNGWYYTPGNCPSEDPAICESYHFNECMNYCNSIFLMVMDNIATAEAGVWNSYVTAVGECASLYGYVLLYEACVDNAAQIYLNNMAMYSLEADMANESLFNCEDDCMETYHP